MEKYYTPEIEEFCVGFEYEYKNSSSDTLFEFEKAIINSSSSFLLGELENESEHLLSNIEFEISQGYIRVKYLDKEDIEEQGFIFSWEDYDKGDFTLTYIRTEINSLLILKDSRMSNGKIFVGQIKNKSELKKLLKQLFPNETHKNTELE
jgi:hypothetical protein